MTTQLSTCCLQPVRTRLAPLSEEDVYQYECKACGKLCDLLPPEAPASPAGLIARIDDMLFVKPESDTPRTDAVTHPAGEYTAQSGVVMACHMCEMERELTAANARADEWKRLALLGDDEARGELAESHAREVVLRERVTAARDASKESVAIARAEGGQGGDGYDWALGEQEAYEDVLGWMKESAADAPPVVPKSVADGLAEALLGCAARLSGSSEAPGPLENVKAIESALTAYREATKP